jgi:hypothetical protein
MNRADLCRGLMNRADLRRGLMYRAYLRRLGGLLYRSCKLKRILCNVGEGEEPSVSRRGIQFY